ncbi:MAG: RNA pseudouridine synthase [Puniceicoccales bacterium]|jgi:23S rRNA-/tRNA-specific pseudouridylate synthase|nr:RNA pseudouridine synthase [Puniceicoccales bacterium]
MAAPWTLLWPALLRALHRSVQPVHCDGHGLCSVDKASGVLSHPNGAGASPLALLRAPYDLRRRAYRLPEGCLFLLNRLDAATEGILLLALDGAVAAAVRESFADGRVQKVYHALVEGSASRRERWCDRLLRRSDGSRLEVRPGGSLRAETDVIPLEVISSPWGPLTLLQLSPLTGRTHQLRVQCAVRHLPILGDELYGNFSLNRALRRWGLRGMQLHSSRLRLSYQLDGITRHFAATAPSLSQFLDRCRLLRPLPSDRDPENSD